MHQATRCVLNVWMPLHPAQPCTICDTTPAAAALTADWCFLDSNHCNLHQVQPKATLSNNHQQQKQKQQQQQQPWQRKQVSSDVLHSCQVLILEALASFRHDEDIARMRHITAHNGTASRIPHHTARSRTAYLDLPVALHHLQNCFRPSLNAWQQLSSLHACRCHQQAGAPSFNGQQLALLTLSKT